MPFADLRSLLRALISHSESEFQTVHRFEAQVVPAKTIEDEPEDIIHTCQSQVARVLLLREVSPDFRLGAAKSRRKWHIPVLLTNFDSTD